MHLASKFGELAKCFALSAGESEHSRDETRRALGSPFDGSDLFGHERSERVGYAPTHGLASVRSRGSRGVAPRHVLGDCSRAPGARAAGFAARVTGLGARRSALSAVLELGHFTPGPATHGAGNCRAGDFSAG